MSEIKINSKRTRSKYRPFFGLILFAFLQQVSNAQVRSLWLETCQGSTPIESAYIFNENSGKVIGITNEKGKASLFESVFEWPLSLRIYKMSALDTLLQVDQKATRVCLNEKSHRLTTVDITSPKEDIAESFRKYLEYNIGILRSVDSVRHYSFEWTYMLPDSNWSMHAKGTIKLPYKSYSRAYSGAYAGTFCALDLTIDEAFYQSNFMNDNLIDHIDDYFLLYDWMRKRFPLRKRIDDEMVLKKITYAGQANYVFSTRIRKDWKLSVSYLQFDIDSTLTKFEGQLELLEPEKKQSADFDCLEEYSEIEYAKYNGELIVSSIYSDDKRRHKTGSISTVQFQAKIIEEEIPECAGVSFFTSFNKKGIEEIRQIVGVSVKIE